MERRAGPAAAACFQSLVEPLKMKSILFQVVRPASLMRALGVTRERESEKERVVEREREEK